MLPQLPDSRLRASLETVTLGKKMLIVFSLALPGALAIALRSSFIPEKEPAFNNHTLAEWVICANDRSGPEDRMIPRFLPTMEELHQALSILGTNNFPLLTRRIAYDPRASIAWELRISRLSKIFPRSLIRSLEKRIMSDDARADQSVSAFQALGALGAPAIPKLVQILDTGSPVPAKRALQALAFIGQPALPSLVVIAANPKHSERLMALECLGHYTHVPEVMAVLTRALGDPDQNVRNAATNVLVFRNTE